MVQSRVQSPAFTDTPLSAVSVYIRSTFVNRHRGERIYTLILVFIAYRMQTRLIKLSRKPLLIPTDVGNVSKRSEAPPTDRENLSDFLWYCFYTGSLGKLSSTRNAVSSARKAYYRLEASIQYLSTPVTHQLEGRHRRLIIPATA